jgi:phosphoglycerate dehydrogenase-like enzyme
MSERLDTRQVQLVLQMPRARYELIFTPENRRRLAELAKVAGPCDDEQAARTILPQLAEADVLFLHGGVRLDRESLAGASQLRWISDTSGGPPAIDYPTAFAQGITVTDTRPAPQRAVAEMALALYLAVMRDVVVHDRALHTPDLWDGRPREENQEASHRTLGFVGFGGIAQMLVRFLAPLEPTILAHDPYIPMEVFAAHGVEPTTLHDLLRRSDAVFILAMVTPETRKMIGAAELDLLRPDSVLLVMSRAALVDEAALIARLQAGRFRAAMDVFGTEPLPVGHPYRSLPNVVLTPHRAGGTRENWLRIGQSLTDDLDRFVAGEPPIHTARVDETLARRLGRVK